MLKTIVAIIYDFLTK